MVEVVVRLQIEEAVAAFGAAARRAAEAGFDGVHIHGANGYLISEFRSHLTNRRTDEWGGTQERRDSFAVAIVRAVRDALADPIEWDIALSPGGALEAAIEAREKGLIRWIGVTGHGAQIAATHRRSLDRFDFDSVLLPYNYVTMQNSYYRENFDALLETCRERNVAVQTIKSIAHRPWMERDHTRTTWYQPLEDPDDIDLAVWWAMGRQGIFLNSVGDVDLLPLVLDAAKRFHEAPDDKAMEALVERSRSEPLFV